MQARMTAAKLADARPLVRLRAIPQQEDRAAQMSQQASQECDDLLGGDVDRVKRVEQPQTMANRTDGDSGNHGDLVPRPAPVVKQRRLSPRRPRLANVRDHQESRFVCKNDVGTHPRGVFFTCGQCLRLHCSMAASSRSSARRVGF